jgi:hypothetical protein
MFERNEKLLTIKKEDLTAKESREFKILVQLGDSENLALWSIEHISRMRQRSNDQQRFAHHG